MVTEVKSVDPRVKRTRQLLQQALLEVSREKSFASITVQDIAERATVNRATFYAHFEDKYELLDSIIRERFQREVASKLSCESKWGLSFLRELIEAVFDFVGEVHCQCQPTDRPCEPLFERAVQQELAKLLVSWLKQVPACGTEWQVPLETMAVVMSWAMFGAAAQWSREGKTTTKEQMVNHVLSVFTEGGAHLSSGFVLE